MGAAINRAINLALQLEQRGQGTVEVTMFAMLELRLSLISSLVDCQAIIKLPAVFYSVASSAPQIYDARPVRRGGSPI